MTDFELDQEYKRIYNQLDLIHRVTERQLNYLGAKNEQSRSLLQKFFRYVWR